MAMKIFTIGVYGSTEEEFFNKLITNKIDTFCDIRQRRGVRGSKYSFVNSKYLQSKLKDLGINYIYEKNLAPTSEIREMQWAEDKLEHQTKKTREVLGHAFVCGYEEMVLNKYNFEELIDSLKRNRTENVVFFCLETNPEACHRSLLAKKLSKTYNFDIINL